jgi:hypothetical protein
MSFEIRGAGVKCLVEEEFLDQQGNRQRTGQASPQAKAWATTMTNKFGELAGREPIFGQLRNCMDMAVLAALLTKEHLWEKSTLQVPMMQNAKDLPTVEFNAPSRSPARRRWFAARRATSTASRAACSSTPGAR